MAWQETLQRILSSNETFRLSVEETIELYNNAPPVSYTHLTLPTN